MPARSKLVRIRIENIGCIGPEGLEVELDNVLCLVGANNTGKSTILRAYELAVGAETFGKDRDLCTRANGQPARVELWVHIPRGTPNIAETWKTPEGSLLLVRSRWEWSEIDKWNRVRRTWDPSNQEFADVGKASGLDEVFDSRLPKPFRIGTLDDPKKEHEKLLTLILEPVAKRLDAQLKTADSPLSKALRAVMDVAEVPVREEQAKLGDIKADLNESHNEVFPDLRIDFQIGLGELKFDPLTQLRQSSLLRFREWTTEVGWHQQGTGSQRALFWTMLQVRSRLNALSELATLNSKRIAECEKGIAKCDSKLLTLVKNDAKARQADEKAKYEDELRTLRAQTPEAALAEQEGKFALPGYMLLIDEPEVALHPGAVRAASKYLYGLAEDPAWQVMMTTHSPVFIDPLHDHTTIVRLDRSKDSLTPRTYRADDAGFAEPEKKKLKMLNRFDQGLAEMFFGQHPVLVEGDTEFAAFETLMNLEPTDFPPAKRPILVRARGKATLRLIVRMLRHFKVPFSILHDADSPRRSDGKMNSAWIENALLYDEIEEARQTGIRVVHRISVPCFEASHLPARPDPDDARAEASTDDKPWKFYQAVIDNEAVRDSVSAVLKELQSQETGQQPFDVPFPAGLEAAVKAWAAVYADGDHRYQFG
jgi:predicted ATPase